MKIKFSLVIVVALMIIATTIFGVYSHYKNKAEQEIVTSLKIHRDSVDELQTRIQKFEDVGLNNDEKEIIYLANTLLTKQSYMIGTQLANYDKDESQFYHDLYSEFGEDLELATTNGNIEEIKSIIKDYKNEVENFIKKIKT